MRLFHVLLFLFALTDSAFATPLNAPLLSSEAHTTTLHTPIVLASEELEDDPPPIPTVDLVTPPEDLWQRMRNGFAMPDLDSPLTKQSASLTLTVQLAELTLGQAAGGAALSLLPDGSGTEGNWIQITADAARLPRGTSIALYATDAAGNPVDADGHPVGSIADAVLGWVGAVGADSGAILLAGGQAVYLAAGLHLRFGHADGQGGVTPAGTVAIRDNGDGSFTLGLGEVSLDAAVGNTLTDAQQAASVQRIFGLPLVHLQHGQMVEVAMSGSTAHVNTLGFVRLDLDQANGSVSLGGVAYEDGAAFRAAARAALDAGFAAAVGGDFARTETWTVAGEDGYYAPVLITQPGDIFVPGTGNADGREYIRIYGANTFGFEDLTAAQGSDFDYNDLVMRLRPLVHDAIM